MNTLLDYKRFRDVRESLSRGRLLNDSDASWLASAAIADCDRESTYSLARANAEKRIQSGARINSDNLLALQRFAPDLMQAYAARRRGSTEAKSNAERKAAWSARHADIGAPPPVANPQRRAACSRDLAAFGQTYCAQMLAHAPSPHILRFVSAIEDALLHGGKVHVRFPRGKGKTTWIKIATLWALSYGHRRFVVIVAATAKRAQRLLKEIYRIIRFGDDYYEDFPEIAHPFRELNDASQRAKFQHINGLKTEIEIGSDRLRLPTVAGSAVSGSIVSCFGVGGSVRGESDGALRPDEVLIDDAQKRGDARSLEKTNDFETFVTQDLYGLAGHNRQISVLMASTPVSPNDASCRFADPDRHPEMRTVEIPLIITPPKNTALWEEFARLFQQDQLIHADDKTAPWMSRQFYDANRAAMDDGCEVIDPLDGDPDFESSAIHHAFVLRSQMGEDSFNAEYQMTLRREAQMIELSPTFVANRLNGTPVCQLPLATTQCVAYCDVNARADVGLRWGVMAFGRGNVAALVAYGRYPEQGRLYPEKATDAEINNAVARGLAIVTRRIAALPLTRSGVPVKLTALCFDGGWRTAAVSAFCRAFQAPFSLIHSKGFNWRYYAPSDKIARPANHCHLSEAEYGRFLAIHADYWREYAHRALLSEPLQYGSLSFYGTDPKAHAQLAEEICAEELIDTGTTDAGKALWVWRKRSPENHFGDVVSSLFAVAEWYRLLERPERLSVVAAASTLSEASGSAIRPRVSVKKKRRIRYAAALPS